MKPTPRKPTIRNSAAFTIEIRMQILSTLANRADSLGLTSPTKLVEAARLVETYLVETK